MSININVRIKSNLVFSKTINETACSLRAQFNVKHKIRGNMLNTKTK